jgi:hypothetical protein
MLTKCENNSLKGCTRRVRGSFEKLTPDQSNSEFFIFKWSQIRQLFAGKKVMYISLFISVALSTEPISTKVSLLMAHLSRRVIRYIVSSYLISSTTYSQNYTTMSKPRASNCPPRIRFISN